MAQPNPNVVHFTSTYGRQITPEWQQWIAENLLMGKDSRLIAEAMNRDGFDLETAIGEIRAAQGHPYIAAALGAGVGAAPSLDKKLKKRDWVLEVYRRTARQATTFGQVPRVRKPTRQEFLDNFYAQNRPVVIEGAMDDWPALTRWTAEKGEATSRRPSRRGANQPHGGSRLRDEAREAQKGDAFWRIY